MEITIRLRRLIARKKIIWPLFGVLVLGMLFWLWNQKNHNLEIFEVKRGDLLQEVLVTGKVKAIENVDLAFERVGKVRQVYARVGDRVTAGSILVKLDVSELEAQLEEAQATMDSQMAKLTELKLGSRPEEIDVKRAELRKAEQDLENSYREVLDLIYKGYNYAADAILKQLDPIFTNDEEARPQLSFSANNSQLVTKVEADRKAVSFDLEKWLPEANLLSLESSPEDLDLAIRNATDYLNRIRLFLNDVMEAVVGGIGLSASTSETYKTNINTARTNVNSAIADLGDQERLISTQNFVLQKIEREWDLLLAGSTTEQVVSQEALVRQAQAKVGLIKTQIAKSSLISPISGIVTQQDVEVGELVNQNEEIVSVIAQDRLEIEANVSEVDIGKIAIGNPVKITLDAFPDETFSGQVGYIDPAETLVNGVVNYKIKVVLDGEKTLLKSGLTANLGIQTLLKKNVLRIPSFIVAEGDLKKYVNKLDEAGEFQKVQIETGIRGQDGSLEIISGLKAGDKVVRIEAN